MFWLAPIVCLLALLLDPGVRRRAHRVRRGRHRIARVPQHQGYCDLPDGGMAELRNLREHARHRAIESA